MLPIGSYNCGVYSVEQVGEMKVIVDCYWRSTKQVETAQLYNLTADPAELHNLGA